MSSFDRLFVEHVGSSWAKQIRLSELLGDDHEWRLDMDAGTVRFNHDQVYPVQILGSESEITQTWLWAWANKLMTIPPELLRAVNDLAELGNTIQVPELTVPEFSLEHVTGHELALVASGVCRADAYYRGPYEGGAVFFLIFDMPPAQALQDRAGVSRVLSEVISTFDIVDHRGMADSYLRDSGYLLTGNATKLHATAPDGRSLRLTFDSRGRLTKMFERFG